MACAVLSSSMTRMILVWISTMLMTVSKSGMSVCYEILTTTSSYHGNDSCRLVPRTRPDFGNPVSHLHAADVDDNSYNLAPLMRVSSTAWECKIIENPSRRSSHSELGCRSSSGGSLWVISVTKGLRYRMRLINVACDPNYIFSIDNHDMYDGILSIRLLIRLNGAPGKSLRSMALITSLIR